MLMYIGSTILGLRVISVYIPKDGDDYLRAIHFAENETELNNSMRSYVDDLDASYNK